MPDKVARNKIVIDRYNTHQFWLIVNDLRAKRPDLEKMLHNYPVELSAFGFYRLVTNIGEVDEVIVEVERGLALYRRQKPKHRRPISMTHLRLDKRVANINAKAADLRRLIVALQTHRDFIKEESRHYPLECIMCRMRFVFCRVIEVDWLIGELKRWAAKAEREERKAEAFASLPWWKRILAVGA